jgi:ribonuclease HIII
MPKEKECASDRALTSWIGTDESGKGDYFGPLVIAGVLVTLEAQKDLLALGIGNTNTLLNKSISWLSGPLEGTI